MPRGKLAIFSCRSGERFTKGVIRSLKKEIKIKEGKRTIRDFSDEEINIRIDESIRGKDVFVIQSLQDPLSNRSVNVNLMEFLFLINAAKSYVRKGGIVTAVSPYPVYGRQDRPVDGREVITAAILPDLYKSAGADSVMVMDIHSGQQWGFYKGISFDNLSPRILMKNHIKKKYGDNLHDKLVLISPDVGGGTRVRDFAYKLGVYFYLMEKTKESKKIKEMFLIGDPTNVVGKTALIMDDIVDTAGTLEGAILELENKGAKEAVVYCTHALLNGKAVDRISKLYEKGFLKKIIATNTVFHGDKKYPWLQYIKVDDLFAQAILRTHKEESVGELYEGF